MRELFARMKEQPKEELVNVRYREKMEERKALLRTVHSAYTKAVEELEMLKAEIIKSLKGESTFPKELLGTMVSDGEKKCAELQEQYEAAKTAYEEGKSVMASLDAQYEDICSWADLYDTASMEAKKMIVSCLIKRVEVSRGYKLHIDFNIDFAQFSQGLDITHAPA